MVTDLGNGCMNGVIGLVALLVFGERNGMSERGLILLVVVAVTVGLWQLWRFYQMRRLATLAKRSAPAVLAGRLAPGPTVLYFTGPHCAQCRLQQTPILTQLTAAAPVNLHTIDAVQEEQVARFYGVMTVPTTILLDRTHTPKAINHGLVSLPQLRQQVAELLV
ncbi:MAG: thioredoxin [Caldilinea sp. CFX5]|nr:thioredoxin [Caldilinea sp. CFX5]